jgi:hypothetical protein
MIRLAARVNQLKRDRKLGGAEFAGYGGRLCSNVQRAARSIGRRYDEAFRPLGLTNWQFAFMVATFRPEPPIINALADALATDRATITAESEAARRARPPQDRARQTRRRMRRVSRRIWLSRTSTAFATNCAPSPTSSARRPAGRRQTRRSSNRNGDDHV